MRLPCMPPQKDPNTIPDRHIWQSQTGRVWDLVTCEAGEVSHGTPGHTATGSHRHGRTGSHRHAVGQGSRRSRSRQRDTAAPKRSKARRLAMLHGFPLAQTPTHGTASPDGLRSKRPGVVVLLGGVCLGRQIYGSPRQVVSGLGCQVPPGSSDLWR